MYRIQLLQAFGFTQWDEAAMDNALRALFDCVGGHPDITALLNKAKVGRSCEAVCMLIDSDDYTIFTNLFQFDLFDIFHRCVCDVITVGKVAPAHSGMLEKAME